MSRAKYIGLDVHQATTVAAVLDVSGKLVMQAIIETKASTVVEFIRRKIAAIALAVWKKGERSACEPCARGGIRATRRA